MRILLLQNIGSRYGVLSAMTTALCSAFTRQGVEATLFDAWEEGPSALFHCITERKPDCTFGINLFAHKELPFASYGINHICLCVDALNHYNELTEEEIDQDHTIGLFIDAWSSDLYRKRRGRSFWFPHAISKEFLDELPTKEPLPRADRPYDVVLLGSYLDCEQELVLWKNFFSTKHIDAFLDLVEQLLEDANSSIQHTVLAFLDKNPSIKEILKKNSLSPSQFISSIEEYVRGLDRKRLLQAFKGEHVHIFGEGWAPLPHCTLHPPIAFSSVYDVCAQAKVVLNSIPMIRRGYHERLFLGLRAGAIVVTSKLNAPHLENAQALIQYTTSSLPKIPESVLSMAELPPPIDWLKKHHTWDIRVKNFLSWLDSSSRKKIG